MWSLNSLSSFMVTLLASLLLLNGITCKPCTLLVATTSCYSWFCSLCTLEVHLLTLAIFQPLLLTYHLHFPVYPPTSVMSNSPLITSLIFLADLLMEKCQVHCFINVLGILVKLYFLLGKLVRTSRNLGSRFSCHVLDSVLWKALV